MLPDLRKDFNARFTPQKYQQLLQLMQQRCGTPVKFRVCETPCFFPQSLLETMARYGVELVHQLDTPEYRQASDRAIPPEFNTPNQTPHPLFVQVDFGLVQDSNGRLQPKLVELQGFPSLYCYQPALCESYRDVFALDERLQYLLGGLNPDSYRGLLRKAVVGDHDPTNVVLMEIEPLRQKTLPDFLLTEKQLGIRTVSITDIKKDGRRLFHEHAGKRVLIERIYNRAIVDELIRKNLKLAFRFSDDLEVEWAGHPNWFFRLSKFSLPFLNHPSVPQSWFLDRVEKPPDDLHNYILKPLFSFAGLGVLIEPTRKDIAAIPAERRSQYILQQRMHFEPVIETPFGLNKAEVRIMYIWLEELLPVLTIIRMGRGLMMGVDHNRNLEWVGSSAGFYLRE